VIYFNRFSFEILNVLIFVLQWHYYSRWMQLSFSQMALSTTQ